MRSRYISKSHTGRGSLFCSSPSFSKSGTLTPGLLQPPAGNFSYMLLGVLNILIFSTSDLMARNGSWRSSPQSTCPGPVSQSTCAGVWDTSAAICTLLSFCRCPLWVYSSQAPPGEGAELAKAGIPGSFAIMHVAVPSTAVLTPKIQFFTVCKVLSKCLPHFTPPITQYDRQGTYYYFQIIDEETN